MEKEFIPHKLALRMKELGFDEPCLATYNTDRKISRNPSHNMEDLPIEGQPYYWQNSKIHISCISAPLYQQAFRWFRKEYEVECFIKHFKPNDGYPNGYYCISNPNKYYSNSTSDWCFTNFKSYEEAELECLKKLIEIVESKKNNTNIK